MPNTYTQIYLHFVFTVKYRKGLIDNKWKDQLYKYITGIIQGQNHKLLAINGMPDHIHILICFKPSDSISELMKSIKQSSSKWINENNFTNCRFEWQEGFGAFSYGKSQLNNIIKYIDDQEVHHTRKSFHEEYLLFLKKFEVDFDEKYLFKELI